MTLVEQLKLLDFEVTDTISLWQLSLWVEVGNEYVTEGITKTLYARKKDVNFIRNLDAGKISCATPESEVA